MVVPAPLSGKNGWAKVCHWLGLRPGWTLTLILLAMLGPFLAKPFNLDDALFI